MKRTLVIPAAGRGSRLGSCLPKLLTAVAGCAMIDRVLARHARYCLAAILVVNPFDREAVETHLSHALPSIPVSLVVQPEPTGMLDALLAARDEVARTAPDRVWISWCDQVAISAGTAARLADLEVNRLWPPAALPVALQASPYVLLERHPDGRLKAVRHRREGDAMPAEGESDAGLFSLSARSFLIGLPEFAASAPAGAMTGERNFLPFLPWLARRGSVLTFEVDPIEALGVNTPDDLARIEQHLTRRPPS